MEFNFDNVGTTVASDLPKFSENAIKEVYQEGFKYGGEKNKAGLDNDSERSGGVEGNAPSELPNLEITGEANGKEADDSADGFDNGSMNTDQKSVFEQEDHSSEMEQIEESHEEFHNSNSASCEDLNSSESSESGNLDANGNSYGNEAQTGELRGNAASDHQNESQKKEGGQMGSREQGQYPRNSIEQLMDE